MNDWRERWQGLMKELEQERDELRVQMHLAKAEAKEELARMDAQLDAKLAELKARAATFDKDGDGNYLDDVGDAARNLAGEIREGFQKFRQMF